MKLLFERLYRNPELMPGYFQRFIPEQGLKRTVADYNAGMTDRYCLKMLAKTQGSGSHSPPMVEINKTLVRVLTLADRSSTSSRLKAWNCPQAASSSSDRVDPLEILAKIGASQYPRGACCAPKPGAPS